MHLLKRTVFKQRNPTPRELFDNFKYDKYTIEELIKEQDLKIAGINTEQKKEPTNTDSEIEIFDYYLMPENETKEQILKKLKQGTIPYKNILRVTHEYSTKIKEIYKTQLFSLQKELIDAETQKITQNINFSILETKPNKLTNQDLKKEIYLLEEPELKTIKQYLETR